MVNKKLALRIVIGIVIVVIVAAAAVFAYNAISGKSPKGKTVPATTNSSEPFPPTGVWDN